jgi:5-methyltetrahydrofolate--homocysteine methyltransferase
MTMNDTNDRLERIAFCLERGKADAASPHPAELAGQPGVEELVRQALERDVPPGEVLDRGLVPGMEAVARRFHDCEIFLPDVLMAARAMNAGLKLLQPFFLSGQVRHRGTVVMGTVSGDIHDIGKKIVSLIFEGGGWRVVDVGVDAGAEKFLEAIGRHAPQAVGLSALLTTTMAHMASITAEVKARHPGLKVIIGGAPVTQSFADRIGADAYAPDPRGGLEFLNSHCVLPAEGG